jgi:ATP-dependent Clp protease adapter protein ClpS
MPQTTVPAVIPEDEIADKIGDLFEDHYAVIIMDSDFTTFSEVENACVTLFGYTPAEAASLAMKVHTTGEALAVVVGEVEARRAVRSLRARNVLARIERI